MIVSMACDYRLVINHPKIKLGMTEIKLSLALSPAEVEIMKFGLDTDKKYRDVIFGGELFNPELAVQREIFDELVADEDISCYNCRYRRWTATLLFVVNNLGRLAV
jgi:hypothetical protein